jgi:NAD(P)-dependent dehydrogenase (short-subunit alcohol dehydrogenase family)
MEGSLDLKGRIILVTGGGGTGVGAGVCKVLSQLGATVILNELDLAKAEQAAKQYPGAVPVAADISKSEEIARMFEQVEREVGLITGLVNNAGVGLCKVAHEASEEQFERLYDIDVKGVWLVSKAFTQRLIAKGEFGNIVNVSSIHAHSTWSRYAIYASAKAAVEGLTRGMAMELGSKGIRVNAIGPGYVPAEQNYDLIRTWTDDPEKWEKDFIRDQQAINYEIQPVDCGNTAAFLLSDLSRAITGQTLYVDAGLTSLGINRSSTGIIDT